MFKGKKKKKIQKEKKFYFSDIRPIIIDVVILIALIILLIVVVKTKGSDLVKDDTSSDGTSTVETKLENQLTEETITLSDDSCAIANQDEINDITTTISFEDVYVGQALAEGSDPDNLVYEDVYQKVTVITFDNLDPTKYTITAKIKDGDDVSSNIVYDEYSNSAIFMTNNATIIQQYEITIKQIGCSDVVKKYDLVAPIYNHFKEIDLCKIYPEYEWCSSEISYKDLPTWTEFYHGIENYGSQLKNNEITTKTTQEIDSSVVTGHNAYYDAITTTTKSSTDSKESKKDIFKYIIIGICVILAIVIITGTIIIFKKRGIKE